MASQGSHVTALVRTHASGDEEAFYAVALQRRHARPAKVIIILRPILKRRSSPRERADGLSSPK